MMPVPEVFDPEHQQERAPAPATKPVRTAILSREPISTIRSTSIRGLSLLPCGELPSNPAEALQTGGIRALLEAYSDQFDVVIIDTAPLLVSADAAILAPSADGVIMVIRAGQTDRASAERAYEQLVATGAPVLGTVLNDPAGEVTRYRTLYYAYDYPVTPD